MAKKDVMKSGTAFAVPKEVINNPDRYATWLESHVKQISKQKGESIGAADGQRLYRLPDGQPLISRPMNLPEKIVDRLSALVFEARQRQELMA